MTGVLWLLAWPAIAIPAGVAIGWRAVTLLKHPPQASTPAAGTSPVPGQSPSPVDGQPVPRLAGHAPAPAHGGLIRHTEIKVYADCRTEITDHIRRGGNLTLKGHCTACRPIPGWGDADDAAVRDLLS